MALRNLADVRYLPLLSVRPAEMLALQSLPERDKGLMLPFFKLGPWLGSYRLDSSLARLEAAYGTRPCYLDICEREVPDAPREVHEQLDQLRSPERGFEAWCVFVEEHQHFMPALQLTDVSQFNQQAIRLHALNRGLIVPIELEAFQFIRQISSRTGAVTQGGQDVLFLLDFGRQNRNLLLQQAECVGHIRTILSSAPNARVAISASSFPTGFVGISRQEIFERQLFLGVAREVGDRLIYSDRGSARAERQLGGGGTPAPRIDYAQSNEWTFFRADDAEDRLEAYQQQAQRLIRSPIWDAGVRVWGTQMIERTARGEDAAIASPARSTAARINLHLHQQLFYGDPDGLHDTDEDWTD